MFANGYHPDPNAKEPILDFFGVSVKAEDVPQQVERMYLLKKKVGALSSPLCCYMGLAWWFRLFVVYYHSEKSWQAGVKCFHRQ